MPDVSTLPPTTGKAVDIDKIEKSLQVMWRDMVESQSAPVVRATVVNLLVYTASEPALQEMTKIIAELSERHPARAIVMQADSAGATSEIDAWLTMHCRRAAQDGKQVCGEQITMVASGETVDQLASAIHPLILPRVPVMIFWRDMPNVESPLIRRMLRVVDRVLFDTTRPSEGHQRLGAIADLVQAHPRLIWGDLTWSRLTAWRELLAQFFDPPAQRPALNEITSVQVAYVTSDPVNLAAPLLLVGWLASRLGWQLAQPLDAITGAHPITGQFHHAGRPILVTLDPVAPQGDDMPGALMSVQLTATVDQGERHFRLARQRANQCGETQTIVDGQVAAQRVVALEPPDEVAVLSEELDMVGHDYTFQHAVQIAKALLAPKAPAKP